MCLRLGSEQAAGIGLPVAAPKGRDPSVENAVTIAAAMIIRAQFAQDNRSEDRVVVTLFDAILELLTGSDHRH